MAKLLIVAAVLLVAIAGTNAASVYETAKQNNLTTFIAAVDVAGYKSILNNGNFKGTVWAPTNEGFAATLAELNITGAALLANKNLVKTVLNYHIIYDDVLYRNDLAPLQDWGTNLEDQTIAIVVQGKAKIRVYYGQMAFKGTSLFYPGYAQVVKQNVKANSAVVQIIDKVLLPTFTDIPSN